MRTSAVHGLAVGAAPGQLGDGNADGPAAQQDVVSDGAADPGDGRVDAGSLTLAELGIREQHS